MLRSGQLAERIGLSKNKIIELANQGLIPCIRLPSGHYRFDEVEVVGALRAENSETKNDD
jgi:predicted site-specific integrase-resolvase